MICLKKLFKYIFLFIFLFSLNIKCFAVEENTHSRDLSRYSINPTWEGEDSKESIYGIVLDEYVLENNDVNLFEIAKSNNIAQANLPSKFDLRYVDGVNYVTPVKNQSTLGLCWAFSTISSMETYLRLHGMSSTSNLVTFNERQLDYATVAAESQTTFLETPYFSPFLDILENPYSYESRELGSGGRFDYATHALSKGFSPVRQEGSTLWNRYWIGDTYNERRFSAKQVFDTSQVSYSVTSYIEYPFVNMWTASSSIKTNLRNKIKEELMENGSVYAATVAPTTDAGSCVVYDASKGTYLVNWKSSGCGQGISGNTYLHAMSIIGWDDTYSLSYCVSDAIATVTTTGTCSSGSLVTVNGAWILKNSWGDTVPYLYLAYDSYVTQFGSITGMVEKDWNQNYEEMASEVGYLVDTNSYTVFYKRNSNMEDEVLKRVSIIHEATSSATFNVYVDADNSGNFVKVGVVNTSYPGMISFDDFTSDVNLTGDTFAIKITGYGASVTTNLSVFTSYDNPGTGQNIDITVYDDELIEYPIDGVTYYTMPIGIASRNYNTGYYYSSTVLNANTNQEVSDFDFLGVPYFFNDASSLLMLFNYNFIPYGQYIYEMNDSNENVIASSYFEIKPYVAYSLDTITLTPGDTIDLSDFKKNIKTNLPVTYGYRSNNSSIASIDSNGLVTGVADGNTTVGLTITVNGFTFYYPIVVEVGDFGLDYDVVDDLVYIEPGMAIDEFEENIRASSAYSFSYSGNSNYLGTGTVLTINRDGVLYDTYTIVVVGDVSGDGIINYLDYVKVYNHIQKVKHPEINKTLLENEYFVAGDMSGDNSISYLDYVKIYNRIKQDKGE